MAIYFFLIFLTQNKIKSLSYINEIISFYGDSFAFSLLLINQESFYLKLLLQMSARQERVFI